MRHGRAGIAALGLVLIAATVEAVDPPGTPRSQKALAVCREARTATGAERGSLLDQAGALAEEAVAADDRDPVAHFALFCALGERARTRGVSLESLAAVRRMRGEVERALELEPQYVAALIGKGALLMNLPWFLGGRRTEGEAMLRHVLALQPDLFEARVQLARGLDACGDRKQARKEAEGALAVAERSGKATDVATARKLLNELPE